MNKLCLFTLILLLPAFLTFGQNKSITNRNGVTQDTGKTNFVNRFFYFEIPSSLNGSKLDPNPQSGLTSGLSDSKLSLKIGFPNIYNKNKDLTDEVRYTGFIEPFAKATTGISSVWKKDGTPLAYGINAGLSKILKHTYWVYTGNANETASEGVWWGNVIGSVERANYNIFNNKNTYGSMLDKRTENLGNIYLAFSHYFGSNLKSKRWLQHIASAGIGYSVSNNYAALSQRTLEAGELKYDPAMTKYEAIVETTTGASGEFVTYKGISGFAELYLPIAKSSERGALYVGGRSTYYGNSKNSSLINGIAGLFFNLKDGEIPKGKNSAKDVVNFAIYGQWKDLKKRDNEDYLKKNFSIVAQASIPLGFL